jgi:N-acetylglucosamine-6-phosphate deacetylase
VKQRLVLTNCRLLDSPTGEGLAGIAVEYGTITQMGRIKLAASDEVIDARGRLAAPGFVDVHIQGAGGADVLDATSDALRTISRTCARFGVTSFLATTVFKPGEKNEHLTVAAGCVGRDLGGAELLGLHLEGPFISPQKRGMILPNCIGEPSDRLLDEILALTAGQLKIITLAPELPGVLPLTRRLTDAGAMPSFGHSSATYEQTLQGFEAGISHVTHLFNAMPSLHHREPGPLVAIFHTSHVTAQLIADGVHIHPAVVKLAFDAMGLDRLIPITDGLQAMGLPDGRYVYNGFEYESHRGTARYKDGTLVGTALGMNRLLERFAKFTGCSRAEAVSAVTANPARLLGIDDRKGPLAVGKDADIVLLDEDFGVYATVVGGRVVYRSDDSRPAL